jgi:hypothetical protein
MDIMPVENEMRHPLWHLFGRRQVRDLLSTLYNKHFSTVHVIARSRVAATKQSPVIKSLSYQNEVATPPKKTEQRLASVPFGKRYGFNKVYGRNKQFKCYIFLINPYEK